MQTREWRRMVMDIRPASLARAIVYPTPLPLLSFPGKEAHWNPGGTASSLYTRKWIQAAEGWTVVDAVMCCPGPPSAPQGLPWLKRGASLVPRSTSQSGQNPSPDYGHIKAWHPHPNWESL